MVVKFWAVFTMAALTTVAAATPPPSRYAESGTGEPFDPVSCKHGDRRFVYWAAGEQVFRFRFDPRFPVFARAPLDGRGGQRIMGIEHVPLAPDPSEPEGCLRNPLRGGGVPYMAYRANELFRELTGRNLDLRTDQQFLGHGYFALPARLRSDDRNALHRRFFEQRARCVQRSQGALQCMDARSRSQDDFELGQVLRLPGAALFAGTGLVPRDVYVLLKKDTVARVSPASGIAASSGIDLYGSVRLLNSFRLLPHEIDALVPFHRGLVRHLAQAHVPGYSWTTTTRRGKKP